MQNALISGKPFMNQPTFNDYEVSLSGERGVLHFRQMYPVDQPGRSTGQPVTSLPQSHFEEGEESPPVRWLVIFSGPASTNPLELPHPLRCYPQDPLVSCFGTVARGTLQETNLGSGKKKENPSVEIQNRGAARRDLSSAST